MGGACGSPSWSVWARSNDDSSRIVRGVPNQVEEGLNPLIVGIVDLPAEGSPVDLAAVLPGASAEKRPAITSLSVVGPTTERQSTAKRARASSSSSAPENR